MKIYSYKTKCKGCGNTSGINVSDDANYKKLTRCMKCGYKQAKIISEGKLIAER
jgi:uncharacterized Zn finger protein